MTNLTRRTFIATSASLLASTLLPEVAFADEVAESAESALEDPILLESELPAGASPLNENGEFTYLPDDVAESESALAAAEAELAADNEAAGVALMASGGTTINEIKGSTRYDTAAQEALAAYSHSGHVVIASGDSYADSLAASGLAGALKCPIVLTGRDSMPSASVTALQKINPSKAVVLGGTGVISEAAVSQLKKYVSSVERLAGPTRYDTQMEIYMYGLKRGYWKSATAFIATGDDFADALAASPLVYALKAPIFFVDAGGNLPEAQKKAIADNTALTSFLLLGGSRRISSTTESYLASLAGKRGGTSRRLSGSDRYATSAEIATYAVKNLGFSWNNLAFTTSQKPFDALAGAALQGNKKAPLLLVDSGNTSAAKAASGKNVSAITFFGGYEAITIPARVSACTYLGASAYANVGITSYGITLSNMAKLEEAIDATSGKTSYETFCSVLNSCNFVYNTKQFLQFAYLNKGYSGISADTLNGYVANNCTYCESRYGRTSLLKNLGQSFIDASKQYGVNEVYLLAHAIWESAWGCSQLACGWSPDEDIEVATSKVSYTAKADSTYYNFYGIGAYDSDALSGGRAMAVKQGWTTPSAAIKGAAQWISNNYINGNYGKQNTLYLMKFNAHQAATSNAVWHQYCTGSNDWVLGIASVMASCYSYAGYSVSNIPVSYNVPSYA